jgi:cytochrome c-type protein NapB
MISLPRVVSILMLSAIAAFLGCSEPSNDGKVPVPGHSGAVKTSASLRAERRAYDGAPPVVPHGAIGNCLNCHKPGGMEVPGLGFAPPNPHLATSEASGEFARCNQCHVHRESDSLFAASEFAGLRQDLRKGTRAHELAPPVIPHDLHLRRDCQACHTGPAAREELRCPHPERTRCTQCHVERVARDEFAR